MHICSFWSDVEDLKKADRTDENVLEILRNKPRISTFTLSEHYTWLPPLIHRLKEKGLIDELSEPYPWHKYKVIKQPG